MGENNDEDVNQSPLENETGVRIVDQDEAAAAIEAGAVIRRVDSTSSFELPTFDSNNNDGESSASARNQGRLVSLVDDDSAEEQSSWADTGEVGSTNVRILGTAADRVHAAIRLPTTTQASSDGQGAVQTDDDDFDFLLDLRGANASSDDKQGAASAGETGGGASDNRMPHWTEPATGEVPTVLGEVAAGENDENGIGDWSFDQLGKASKLNEPEDDLDAAFDALGENPPINHDDFVQPAPSHPNPSAIDSLRNGTNEVIEVLEEKVESLKQASILTRSGTAAVAGGLAILAFSAGPAWAMVLVLAVVMAAAVEYFDALRRVGYRPATALGLLSVAAVVLGTYARGEAAIPLVLALCTAFTFLWYLLGIIKDSPTANVSVTLLGVVWIGIFGSYAAILLRAPDQQGVAFLGAAVILVIVYDTFAYLGGVLIGRNKLIPAVSPSKTWEGLGVATVACLIAGVVGVSQIYPWSVADGLLLAVVIACVAPLGDLAESLIKRDLGLKDMGRLLPGHGGVLDRVDALLFVLPATYYVVRFLNLV